MLIYFKICIEFRNCLENDDLIMLQYLEEEIWLYFVYLYLLVEMVILDLIIWVLGYLVIYYFEYIEKELIEVKGY